jgi:hypothetical protein
VVTRDVEEDTLVYGVPARPAPAAQPEDAPTSESPSGASGRHE